jgi:hypothetical protein
MKETKEPGTISMKRDPQRLTVSSTCCRFSRTYPVSATVTPRFIYNKWLALIRECETAVVKGLPPEIRNV